MRVLVTGASGFIGSHVAASLGEHGHRVVASGRDWSRLAATSAGAAAIPADLVTDDLSVLVKGCEAIVHCAAMASPWGPRDAFWRQNVVATERLLAAADASGSVRRFVHISSPSIYFRWRDQIDVAEEFVPPSRWITDYAETKWVAETRVVAHRGLGPVILRPRAVFGPRDTAIVPRLVAIARRGWFPLPAGGRAWTDVTYVDNVVDSVRLALKAPRDVEGAAFNITNGEPVQVYDLLSRLFGAIGVRTRYVRIPRFVARCGATAVEGLARARRAAAEPRVTSYGIGLLGYSQTLTIAAARQRLGYTPRISLDEGLHRYATWWRTT